MTTWNVAKNKVHDASGIENPELFKWYEFKGIFYPFVLDVISPDGFSISRDQLYPTKKAALAAFEEWKKGYERQGYYSSVKYGRIPLDELQEYCQLKEINYAN